MKNRNPGEAEIQKAIMEYAAAIGLCKLVGIL
jgi:hypothetical protein